MTLNKPFIIVVEKLGLPPSPNGGKRIKYKKKAKLNRFGL